MIERIVQKCSAVLQDYYGARFQGLVLYGSSARGQANSESDIDLLVLLATPFNYFNELRQIIDLLYPIQLESDRLISAKPVLLQEYEQGRLQLYRNAKREGVMV